MNYLTKLKQSLKKAAAALLALTFVSQFVMPVDLAMADSEPRFNFMQNDLKLLQGKNLTTPDAGWKQAISGKAGDVFEGLIYYHNGNINTTAQNTRLRVNLPTKTTASVASIGASISADNAATVSDTLVLTLDKDATIQFVSGSVKWYPDGATPDNSSTPLPSGQSGDELMTSTGLNIGDIQGCWNFSGYVAFQFKTKTPAEITKSKIAKNLTTGAEGADIGAKAGDQVRYTLTTTNGGGTSTSATISDDISDVLEYADLVTPVQDNGVLSAGVISWPSATISAGQSVTRTFTVNVKNPLPNTPQSGFHFDFVMYNVYGNAVIVRLQKPEPGQPNLIIQKTVRNFTKGEQNFVESNQAAAGDTLEYRIEIDNKGAGSADNVVVTDTLPNNVTYLEGTTLISENGGQDRTYIDGITKGGLNLNMAANSHVTLKFKVTTSAKLAGGEILVNTVSAKHNDKTISDTASTKILTPVPVAPTTPQLPKTGAESWVITLLFAIGGCIYYSYRKVRQKLALLK